MKEIMQEIKRVSLYDFIVNDSDITGVHRQTVSFDNATIDEVLSMCLEGTGLTYTIDDATIVILQSTRQQSPRNAVTGRITDSGGRPVVGAAVVIKDTHNGVVTDNNGAYRLNIPGGGEVTLVFSFLGLTTQEVVVPISRSTVDVVMQESSTGIEEVVVTGVFSKPRESYVGAVRVINETELQQFQGRNLVTTIANVDPSFNIIRNNEWGSNPNRLPEVQIRGASNLPDLRGTSEEAQAALNTPLIVMDGFETSLERLMDIDENEVTSITLLKDGSATALYGSRGANGVVVITTKKPTAGKLKVYYKGELNVEVPDLSEYNVLNAREKFELENRLNYYTAGDINPDQLYELQQYREAVYQQILEGVDTYWLSKPLRTGVGQNHNVRVEGGDQAFQYSLALQYRNVEGVMKKSARDNFNGGINLSYNYSNVIFRNHLMVGYNTAKNSPYGSFADYVELNPYWKPYDDSGKPVKTFMPYNHAYVYNNSNNTLADPITNPLYNATLNTFDRSDYVNITNNFSIEWRPVQEFAMYGAVGIVSDIGTADVFKSADHTDFANYAGDDIFRKGSYNYSDSRRFDYNIKLTADYNKVFAEKHHLFAGAQFDIIQEKSRMYSFAAEGFPDESLDFLPAALQYVKDGSPGGSETTTRSIGLVGSAVYSYMDRYFVDASIRLDGSSQFGDKRRFAPFWSAGIGWSIHREKFIADNFSFIDRLKLRLTYGNTGNQNFNSYEAQATYRYYTDDNYGGWVGASRSGLGNDYLEWQKSSQYDIGVELGLFNNLINIDANYYIKKTSNLRSTLELPYSNGFTSYTENIGSLENKGFDIGIIGWLLRNTDRRMNWSVRAELRHESDKITKLSEALKAEMEELAQVAGKTPNMIFREGESKNSLYAVKSLGIDPSTGRELFLTRDGEITYAWNVRDRVNVGNKEPRYRGNISTRFQWRDLAVSMSFGFLWGGQQYNQTLIDKVETSDNIMNVDRRVFTDRWTKPGDRAKYRGISEKGLVYYSSRFVQDNAAFYCQNIYLEYTIRGKRWQDALGLQNIRLSANTGELFYWTTVKQERGTIYPFSRQFSFSASIQF